MEHYTIAKGIKTINYELYFEPDLEKFEFNGKAKITLEVEKQRDEITLNSKELTIKSTFVTGNRQRQEATVTQKDEEIKIKLKERVEGKVIIEIEYSGLHNDKLYGFYRSSSKVDGKTEYILSSQFEAPNARAAFPCVDEPGFKATFDVSMLIDKELYAISNTKIESTIDKGEKKLIKFYTSPKMSTYLLYLGVGKYDILEGSSGKIELRVITTRGKGNYAKLPLEYGKKLFEYLQDYFRVEYPLEKLDFIGVPDFAAGAMENWGAVTYRETALLGDEKTSVLGKQRIAEVIAHELAHQWFGNLVTMKWWDDIWLNESFATFIAYKAVDSTFKDWKMMLRYFPSIVDGAFVADGLINTHPISVEVKTVGEIAQLFDAIGYNKGGSVLLMLEGFVGMEVFRDGLTNYLKKYSYSNATKDDLWNCIEEEHVKKGNQKGIAKIMEDWINREGHPIVFVESKNGNFELSQQRFTISRDMPGVWKIPIKYISEKGEGKVVMDKEKITIENAGKWIKLNFGQAGFYRVRYEKENLEILGSRVESGKLGGLDAWGIENDLFVLVRSGRIKIENYVKFVDKFLLDCKYPANVSVSEHLGWFTSIGNGKKFIEEVKDLSIKFHRRILARLGFEVKEGEDSIDTKLRSNAILQLGFLKDAEVVERAKNIFNEFLKGKEIDSNIKAAIFYTNAYNIANEKNFEEFLNIYKNSKSPEEKIMALGAIGRISNKDLVKRGLDLSFSEIRLQDSMIIPVVSSRNYVGKELYKKWAIENWKKFMKTYSPSSHMLRSYVSAFGSFSDEKSRDEILELFKEESNNRDDIKMAVKQTIERINANIEFIKKNS